MQGGNKIFDDLSKLMTNAVGVAQGAKTEAETAMKGMIDRWMADRNFVTREEFDAVRAMAQKTREENEALAAEAQRVLAAEGVDNAAVVAGSLAEGCAKGGPFDAIMVQGGVQEIPQALIAQLKDGGRIAALFMDGPLGAVKIGHKTGSKMVWRFAFNAAAPVISGFASRHEFAL